MICDRERVTIHVLDLLLAACLWVLTDEQGSEIEDVLAGDKRLGHEAVGLGGRSGSLLMLE